MDDTRSRILETAAELFAEHGYDGTALRQVAERLDITKAALYYHFPSKEAIAVALAEPFLVDVGELLEGTARGADVLDAYLRLLLRHHEVVRIIGRDVSLLAHTSVGGRVEEQSETLRSMLAGAGADPARHLAASAALGALWRPLVQFGTGTVAADADVLLSAARAALDAATD